MKGLIIAAVAALGLSACTADGLFRIPSPGDVGGNDALSDKIAGFCAADFAEENVAALAEWVALYNMVAPMIDREQIDTDGLYQSEAVQKLFAVRSAICLATQPVPAPAVVEAVAAG